jgi:hypothetical protein
MKGTIENPGWGSWLWDLINQGTSMGQVMCATLSVVHIKKSMFKLSHNYFNQ